MMTKLGKAEKGAQADIDGDYAEWWNRKLQDWQSAWKTDLAIVTSKWDQSKLRSDLTAKLVSPDGFHTDEQACEAAWARYCSNKSLSAFIREVTMSRAWLQQHMSDFKSDDGGVPFATYWARIVEAVANEYISVGAAIAAALSLDLEVEPDWGAGLQTDSGWDGYISGKGTQVSLDDS